MSNIKKSTIIQNSTIKKATLLSPLIGAAVLTVTATIYLLILNISLDQQSLIDFSFALVKIMPVLFFVFTLLSYVISLPIGFALYRQLQINLRTEIYFINMSLLIGFLISIIISYINYHLYNTLAKSIFIVIGISLMAIANANYFMVLAGIVKIKDKNETTKDNRF